MEKRKLDLLMLSSDSDLWNLSWAPLSSSSSLCFLFFRLLRRSLALFELSLDVPEEDSEVSPPLPLYSPLSVAAAAATCRPITAHKYSCHGDPVPVSKALTDWSGGESLAAESRTMKSQISLRHLLKMEACFYANQNISVFLYL